MSANSLIHSAEILKEVSFDEAFAYSPWPARITGTEKWQKERRAYAEMMQEYNDGWYREALDYFEKNKHRYENRRNAGGAASFFSDFENYLLTRIDEMPEVYGSLPSSNFLISLGGRLYVANLHLFQHLYRQYIIQTVKRYIQQYNAKAVVEFGSGTGVNLFNIFSYSNIDFVKGGELCPNGVTMGNLVADYFGVNAEFSAFDYYGGGEIARLCSVDQDYILITVHSIEQITQLPDMFIRDIAALPKSPSAVLHFEPVQFPGVSQFDAQCKKYSELNLYNQNLFSQLSSAQDAGTIEMLSIDKHVMGISAFNPTSFIAWRPRPMGVA